MTMETSMWDWGLSVGMFTSLCPKCWNGTPLSLLHSKRANERKWFEYVWTCLNHVSRWFWCFPRCWELVGLDFSESWDPNLGVFQIVLRAPQPCGFQPTNWLRSIQVEWYLRNRTLLAGRTRAQGSPLGGCGRCHIPIPKVTVQKGRFKVANLGRFPKTPQTAGHWPNSWLATGMAYSLLLWYTSYTYDMQYTHILYWDILGLPSIAQETGSSSKGSARVRARHQEHHSGTEVWVKSIQKT